MHTVAGVGSLTKIQIPNRLAHIWIGPRPAPLEWMHSWHQTHSHWEYHLIDNSYVSNRRFRNQRLIEEYMKRGEYAGAADLIRYEYLYEAGGYIPGADSVSLRNTDELWTKKCAYCVYENEIARPGSVSPVMACDPENSFVGSIIDSLSKVPYYKLDKPWKTTGNRFMTRMISELNPDIVIFPSHYFIPRHFTGLQYTGSGKIYADQKFGETTGAYSSPNKFHSLKMTLGKVRSKMLRRLFVGES